MKYIFIKIKDFFRKNTTESIHLRKLKTKFEIIGVHTEERIIDKNARNYYIDLIDRDTNKWVIINDIDQELSNISWLELDRHVLELQMTLEEIKKIILNHY